MFNKVLVANRGEIAVRVLRTCRRLGIASVAVYSDADAEAPYVKLADETHRLGEAPVGASYLNREALARAIRETRAEAVHPGYGLFSEDSVFAEAVREQGATFIGPPPNALRALGNKLEARKLARAAGLAPPPGSDGPVNAADEHALRNGAERIGYPVLVKAAAGGGGIGMQVAQSAEGLPAAVEACARRGQAAFGDPQVYVEKYFAQPRHIELQMLIDRTGQGVCLGERECSVQRRHQKIIEESPSAASFLQGTAGEAKRQQLAAHALDLLGSVDYTGAATVEFLADPEGRFYFLEVNARIQVEHPVTEMVTGLDLVEWQLRVAAGESLAVPVLGASPHGHAIEARLYAEDPAKKFMPQPGKIVQLDWPEARDDLRIDSGVEQGSEITPHYDPMIAKVITWDSRRDGARRKLIDALERTRLVVEAPRGRRQTNREFLVELLSSEAFERGQYDTGLLAELQSGG